MKIRNIMPLGAAVVLTACSLSVDKKADIEQKVATLYQQMTQEERIAQLEGIYLAQFFDAEGQLDTAKCREMIPNGIGHFSQYAVSDRQDPQKLRDMVVQMQTWLMENTPNGIPAMFHEEVLSGVAAYGATVYPQQIGLACSFNPELAEQKTWQTADALRNMGGTLALSPMVDVVRNPSFNRLEESYGEDAYLSAVMGCAFVKGLQHGDKFGDEGIGATTKHFLGYGGGGEADEEELMEEIILPHEAIMRTAESKCLMTGYHTFRDRKADAPVIKCVANDLLQQDILRNYLGFEGLTVSDYSSIEQIDDNLDDVQRAAKAINAGNDVDFPSGVSYSHLGEAIEQGLVSQEVLERAVKNVLRYKAEVGLLDEHPQFGAKGDFALDGEAERQTAYELATQSVVLLENKDVLPLKGEKKIALVGPNANTMWAMLGDYTYHSMRYFWQSQIEDALHPRIVGLKEGLEAKLPEGCTLAYARGCDWTEDVETVFEQGGDPRAQYMRSIQERKVDSGETADLAEALKIAAESDVIIAAVGENVILCGENRDRKGLRLPGKQEQFVQQLIATGKPVVLVVFGGRAQVINGIAEKCAAVIQAWYPGEEGGNALADIIYGNVNPSGKLSVSYPAVELRDPICYNTDLAGDPRIAWPFGYGLSYTKYEYSNIQADKEVACLSEEGVKISVDVKNVGKVDGDEIVQLYISPNDENVAKFSRPILLQGFKRVSLKAGETKTVTFNVATDQFGTYVKNTDSEGGMKPGWWSIQPGKFLVKIGASSTDIRQQAEVTLTGEPFEPKLRRRYFAE